MAFFTMRHSIYGRRVGLSSSGGLLVTPTTSGSTAFDQVAVLADSTGALLSRHDEPVVTTTSTGGATLTFGGIVAINSTAVNPSFLISAPRAGQGMEIYFISTVSTTISFGGTSTSVVFAKMGGVSAGATIITFDHAAPHGNAVFLRGLSATKFGVTYHSSAAWT
jgi:hypothetical protein